MPRLKVEMSLVVLSISLRMKRARSNSTNPLSVSSTPEALRLSRAPPTCSSSLCICLLIAEGASPVTPAARALAKTKGTTVHAAKVAQYDGRRPPLFVRRSVASAVKAAEAKKR